MANKVFKQECRERFVKKSVIANYGNRKVYIVQAINFESGPCNEHITLRDGQRISIAKYFYKTYDLKITDKRQPMLVVKQGGTEVLLPTEFVCIDGVPNTIRQNGQQMRQLLQ